MIVYKCDGCGILSPDENCVHIKNGWITIDVFNNQKYGPDRERVLICQKCAGFDGEPNIKFRYLKSVINKIKSIVNNPY
jgi:hypothetical protein